nr:hypothetical protein [Tanacetum cinerariifolium]
MSYDDIRLIFEAKFNSNIEFLLKTKEQIEEKENRAIANNNETLAQKAAKRRRVNEEAEDVEELKQHLEIVPNEDDDVYTTPLARKVPVLDYQIVHINNKPHFKIVRADETHQLYVSFITLLKSFDREDLEKKILTLEVYIGSDAKCSMTKMEEQSEMSLELIRFTRQQLQEV